MNRFFITVILAAALSSCGFDRPPPASTAGEVSKPVPGNQPKQGVAQDIAADPDRLTSFADQLLEEGPGMYRFDRTREARAGERNAKFSFRC